MLPQSLLPIRARGFLTMLGALLIAGGSACATSTANTQPATRSSAPATAATTGNVSTVDWKAVDAAMGRAGVVQPGAVQRYNSPRGDLSVVVRDARGDVQIRPSLALDGWLAMHGTGTGNAVMAMGDLVLTESERRQRRPRVRPCQPSGWTPPAWRAHWDTRAA